MKLENILQTYGLTSKQAKIYLSCLELGSGSVYKISQKSGFPRSTCYEILDILKEMGLVTTFRRKNIRYFNAEDPNVLIEKSNEKAALIETALPYFKSRYGNNKSIPTVRLYQGKQQLKIILDEILKEASNLYSISSAEDLFREISSFPSFVEKRIKRKIPVKVILRDSAKARERQKLAQQHLREVKIMPDNFEFHSMMYLWNNKVAMLTLTDDFTALVIESEQINKFYKSLFDYMWSSLK